MQGNVWHEFLSVLVLFWLVLFWIKDETAHKFSKFCFPTQIYFLSEWKSKFWEKVVLCESENCNLHNGNIKVKLQLENCFSQNEGSWKSVFQYPPVYWLWQYKCSIANTDTWHVTFSIKNSKYPFADMCCRQTLLFQLAHIQKVNSIKAYFLQRQVFNAWR